MNRIAEKIYLNQQTDKGTIRDHINREHLNNFVNELKYALFSNYLIEDNNKYEIEKFLLDSYQSIKKAFGSLYIEYESKIQSFYDSLPTIREALILDLEAIYQGDPAANSYSEIVSTYPGFTAIYCYRCAHEFYLKGMKHLARLISEYAHSNTGIDINAGAQIGKSFFIDHGTGIVIGETTIIGDNCKLYQGVTLGAISLRDGRKLSDKKRHPTLLINVVIYSGSSIFGGDTVIGNNVTIGANVEVKESVPDNTIVRGNCTSKTK